jgi:hypothetical protein
MALISSNGLPPASACTTGMCIDLFIFTDTSESEQEI